MAFDFPASPTVGQIFASGGYSYIWNGYGWAVQGSGTPSSSVLQEFTATAGQTTFTVTGGYTVGAIIVTRGGAVLEAADYTATNGTTIVLATPCEAGEVVKVIGFLNASASIADSQIDPIKLNSDTSAEQLAFRDRLNFVTRDPVGDTMQGNLTIGKIAPVLNLNRSDATAAQIIGKKGGLNRWAMSLGAADPESTGNVGSGFYITRFDDAGNVLTDVFNINRATGIVTGTGLVNYVPQTLTDDTLVPPTIGQKTQTRINAYAAPFDALSFNGLQINGAMEVSQEIGGGFVTPAPNTSAYVVDRWRLSVGSSPSMFGQQIAITDNPAGFLQCFQMATGGAYPMAAGDYARINQRIEGYRCSRLNWGTANAQPITVAFWVRASRTGTASVAALNNAPTRSYATNFTVTAPNTWEYKRVTINGDTLTSAVWEKTNLTGIELSFTFNGGANSNMSATPDQWVAYGGGFATGAQSNFFLGADTVQVTGVTVLPGLEAPNAARSGFILRPFDQELLLCKRFWQLMWLGWVGQSTNGTNHGQNFQYQTEMRIIPTITFVAAQQNVGFPATTATFQQTSTTSTNGYKGATSTAGGIWADTYSLNARL